MQTHSEFLEKNFICLEEIYLNFLIFNFFVFSLTVIIIGNVMHLIVGGQGRNVSEPLQSSIFDSEFNCCERQHGSSIVCTTYVDPFSIRHDFSNPELCCFDEGRAIINSTGDSFEDWVGKSYSRLRWDGTLFVLISEILRQTVTSHRCSARGRPVGR